MNIWQKLAAGLSACAVLAGSIWALLPAAQATGLLPYRDAAEIGSGAELYAEHCASCHGDDLEGEPNWRQRDADGFLPAPPHDATGHTWHHPDAQLIAITTSGTEAIVGGSYRSRMPGFGEILSPQEITAVLAFIKSTWPAEVIETHNRINAENPGK